MPLSLSLSLFQRKIRVALAVLLILSAVVSPPASAWWDLGHAAVCEASLALIKPSTRIQIESLLQQTDSERLIEPETFGRACTWADRIKPKRKNTSPWHYLNAPPGSLSIASAEHPEQGDIVNTLLQQAAILGNWETSRLDRAEALRWVGHLVGDLHQPMHLGYESDWGGNKYTLKLSPQIKALLKEDKRDKTNMHAVWDGYLLIYATGLNRQSLLDLMSRPAPLPLPTPSAPLETVFNQWADGSLKVLNKPEVHYAVENRLSVLEESYLQNNYEHAVRQLSRSASRLAGLLDQLLTR